MEHEIIAENLRFPEGPVALPNGDVLVVEIAGARLTRIALNGDRTVVAELPGSPNGAAIGPDGACYICNSGGLEWHTDEDGLLRAIGPAADHQGGSIQRVDLKTGEVRTLYTEVDGCRLLSPNDLVFDHDGGLWFTDFGHSRRHQRMDFGGVYYCRTDKSFIVEVASLFLHANGIALSPDDRRLYVAETSTGRLWSFDVLAAGRLAKLRWQSTTGGHAVHTLGGIRRPDSIAVEASGNICIATLHTGAITTVSPEGEVVEVTNYPDPMTTNICFGGADMKSAFVTLSGTGRLARTQWERPGLELAFKDRAIT